MRRAWGGFNNRNRKYDGAEGKRVCLRIRLIMLKSRKVTLLTPWVKSWWVFMKGRIG